MFHICVSKHVVLSRNRILPIFWNINKYTSWEEKCCLLFLNISFRSRDIQVFKICKLAKWWRHALNQILFKYNEISQPIYIRNVWYIYFAVRIYYTSVNVFFNTSLTDLLPWQHTGFQTSPILKAFLATFGIPFSCLQMVPHIHDPASI